MLMYFCFSILQATKAAINEAKLFDYKHQKGAIIDKQSNILFANQKPWFRLQTGDI